MNTNADIDTSTEIESPPPPTISRGFHNPYDPRSQAEGTKFIQVGCPVAAIDVNQIKCTRPALGTLSGVVGTLWHKLTNELRERDITDVSKQSEFESFVSTCRIISASEHEEYRYLQSIHPPSSGRGFSHGTARGAMSESSNPDDRGGITQPGNAQSPVAPVLPDIQSRGGAKGSRKRKSQEGAEGKEG